MVADGLRYRTRNGEERAHGCNLDGLIWTAVFPIKMGLSAQRIKKGREWGANSAWRTKDESANVIRCGCPHVHSVLLRPEWCGARRRGDGRFALRSGSSGITGISRKRLDRRSEPRPDDDFSCRETPRGSAQGSR